MKWMGFLWTGAGLAAPALAAAVITAENFNYPDGPLAEVAGATWTTHSGTTGQVRVADGRLRLLQSLSEDVSLEFPAGPVTGARGAGLYASVQVTFTALPSGHGNYFMHFKDGSPTSGFRCRAFVLTNDAAPGCLRFGIAAGANAPSAVLAYDVPLNTPCRLVCRLDLTNNTSTLWVDPKSDNEPGLTSTDQPSVKAATAIAFRESLASGSGMGELIIDDLVIATSFEEARRWPSFSLTLRRMEGSQVQLAWQADPGQTYSVLFSEDATEPFQLLATGLWFLDEHGVYEESVLEPRRFYRVESP